MNTENDPLRTAAMKTDQSNGRGWDFRGEDEFPPVPYGKIAFWTVFGLAMLGAFCAIAAVG